MIHLRNRRLILFLAIIWSTLLMVGGLDAQGTSGNFTVTYGGRVYDAAADQTTFTYTVTGMGVPPDLSHFDVEIPTCPQALQVVAYSPTDAVSFGTDPTTSVSGIKWNLPLLTTATRTYSITFAGNVLEGTVVVAVKGGPGFFTVTLNGPSCEVATIDIEKFISVDGGVTWQDADSAPGPDAELGAQVSFRFIVHNTGAADLTGISLSDSVFDVSACAIPATLTPSAFFECVIGPFDVVPGQHSNTATVSGIQAGSDSATTDTDSAHYFGGDRPEIEVEKLVSSDGGTTWVDADAAPGVVAALDEEVSFKFIVTNKGNVALSGLTLTDSVYSLAACAQPATLEPEMQFECIVGPFPVEEGPHMNTATATGTANGVTVTDTDDAHYQGGEIDVPDDLPVVIIIEGPVTAININIITIYDIDIVLEQNDPLLTVIQIGDIVRVRGNLVTAGSSITIIAINIVIVNIDVVINNGSVWRDPGDCSNPPPPWAPANGWRRRCEGGRGSGMGMGMGSGMGMGMGRGSGS